MKEELLSWICCPYCKGDLELIVTAQESGEIREGELRCSCGKIYPVKKYIPRFVESDKYSESFSYEWKRHAKTQLDSSNIDKIMEKTSEKQFQNRIDFPLESLKGKLALDAGCGIGRYIEVAHKYGAKVIGFDLSYSIDCAYENIGHLSNVYLLQVDIFNMPFREGIFDFIYSYGVLHHTPDCEQAFKQLPSLLKNDGKLSIFVYSSYNKAIVASSAFWRLFTTRMPKKLLYYFSYISIILYYLYKIPIVGQIGKAFFVIPMHPDWRWRVLDTFDWYSPKYQSKHTHWEVYKWFQDSGFRDIIVHPYEITLSGTKYKA